MIEIDLDAKDPPYAQIRRGITEAVVEGRLAPGTRLPPMRQLAKDLGLALNTVARAYHELELDGLVRSRGRRGTFVAEPPDDVARSAALEAEVARFVERSRELGADRRTTLSLVTRALSD